MLTGYKAQQTRILARAREEGRDDIAEPGAIIDSSQGDEYMVVIVNLASSTSKVGFWARILGSSIYLSGHNCLLSLTRANIGTSRQYEYI